MTTIEWTDATWNPTTGCDQVSEGCDNCYALTMAKRLKGMEQRRYGDAASERGKYQRDGDPRTSGPGFGLTVHPDTLDAPLHWRKPRRVFVNSMSDLFHGQVPDEFIAQVFAVMALSPQHTFQVLTKRPGRMASLLASREFYAAFVQAGAAIQGDDRLGTEFQIWPLSNVWLGTSVENQRWADIRVPQLLRTPAAVRFLSMEPLLGRVDLRAFVPPTWPSWVQGIGWVIVGGESGPNHRQMDADWVRDLRDQCNAAGVAFFFKQFGGDRPKANGRELDGRTWDEYPDVAA